MEKKIICDTNIWYHIANNRVIIPENSQLIATWVNIVELLYSNPENKAKFSKIEKIKAIEAILDKSHDIIESDMIHYAFSLLFPEHNLPFPNENLRNVLEDVLTGKRTDEEFYNEKIVFFEWYKQFKTHFSTAIKDYCMEIRKQNRKIKKYNEIKSAEIDKRAYEFMIDIYNNIKRYNVIITNEGESNEEIKTDYENIKKRFFLYLNARQIYLENITINENFDEMNFRKKENDFGDLYNLMYASDDLYYWTEDKTWYNICLKTNYKNIIPRQLDK